MARVFAWGDVGPATRISTRDAARTLVHAYLAETGEKPALPLAELNLAQLWGESGREGAQMWRYDWGNVSAPEPGTSSAWTGDVWRPPWFELTPDASERLKYLHAEMEAGRAPRAFRGYGSHAEGARGYVHLLVNRYPAIIDAGRRGDVARYADAVRSSRYCPDCGPSYAHTLEALRDEVRRAHAFDGMGLPSGRSGDGGMLLLALALGYLALREG